MRLKTLLSILILSLGCMSLSACDSVQNITKADREGNMDVQDYRDGMASRIQDSEENTISDFAEIPDLKPYIAPPADDTPAMPLVSVSVNQSVPIKDILFELAKQADLDLELDPKITGSIIFTARERPLDQVIERICDVAGLRYTLSDGVMRIEVDTPYHETYKIDYLSYIRKSSGSISNNVSVITSEGADAGSAFSTESESESDFWGEVSANLDQILAEENSNALRTGSDPQIGVASSNPGSSYSTDPGGVLNVQSLPVDGNYGGGAQQTALKPSYTINKQAGIISVSANDKTQKRVREFLQLVKRSVTSQVLIEAKILEVSLSDQYSAGIDWNSVGLLDSDNFNLMMDLEDVNPYNFDVETPKDTFIATITGNDLNALVNAMSRFGVVKALASPRITVTNNQPAILNVATNHVYFEVSVEKNEDDNGNQEDPTIDTEVKSVPVGVLVNVQPSIDLDSDTVTLALRPTISRVSDNVDNIGARIGAQAAGLALPADATTVPEVSVQEIDSVVMTRSGQPIVLGGLLQDRVSSDEVGVPLLSEVPMLGSLFKNQSDTVSKTELVILLKATILQKPSDSVHATDKDLYRQFSSDRRPFRL